MPSRSDDQRAANELAGKIRELGGRRVPWPATAMLSRLGQRDLDGDVRERISTALAEAGVTCEPPLSELKRADTVKLSTAGGPDATSPDALVEVTIWAPGAAPRPAAGLAEALASGHPVWIDVLDPSATPEDVHTALDHHPELSLARIADLLETDAHPGVQPIETARDIRHISAFSVRAEEIEGDDRVALTGRLDFQPVEFLASDQWLISCRQYSTSFGGDGLTEPREPIRHNELRENVGGHWAGIPNGDIGLLGSLILREMVITYSEARRMLRAWLQSWEFEVTSLETEETIERKTLKELRILVGTFGHRLESFDRHDVPAETAWFLSEAHPKPARQVHEYVDRGLSDLHGLSEAIRAAVELVDSHESAIQSERSARLEQLVTIATGVILVPTLVIGFFGVNTRVPGEDSWAGFAVMILIAVLAGAVTYALIQRSQRN